MTMIRTIAACIAALMLAASADAQQTALSAADFAAPDELWSPSLSPNGQYVAAIQATAQGDSLVIIDWRTRQGQAIQLARRDRFLFLDWVRWKNDNRLIFA